MKYDLQDLPVGKDAYGLRYAELPYEQENSLALRITVMTGGVSIGQGIIYLLSLTYH